MKSTFIYVLCFLLQSIQGVMLAMHRHQEINDDKITSQSYAHKLKAKESTQHHPRKHTRRKITRWKGK